MEVRGIVKGEEGKAVTVLNYEMLLPLAEPYLCFSFPFSPTEINYILLPGFLPDSLFTCWFYLLLAELFVLRGRPRRHGWISEVHGHGIEAKFSHVACKGACQVALL